MKVPISWLADFVELNQAPEATAEMLTSAGMKVEKIHRLGEGLEGVVAGEVVGIEPHPNADKLTLVTVDLGDRTLRVVCGASNFRTGDMVPVALPGSRLPELGTLEARKIRGIASEGMLCSPMEMGYGEDHSGILVLDAAVEKGVDVRQALGLNDTVLELEITPNRPDAMSLMGVAREVSACTGARLKLPDFPLEEGASPIQELLEVEVDDTEGCPRYVARVIEAVNVAPSPALVQRRLSMAGIRPISNVVDATNYGMLVTGHPMHAFDLDLLDESRLIIRRAKSLERLTGLDGEERTLDPDDLVIADASRPVALAGLMGGLQTGVGDGTKRIALESAYFDPRSIFRSSQRHGLRTESSSRFERGADPNNAGHAAGVAASLILQWAGGRMAAGTIDVYPQPVLPRTVALRPDRARAVLGVGMGTGTMREALSRLGLETEIRDDSIQVTAPTRRRDLVAEEDLIEEIARVVGYDHLPSTLPAGRHRAALPSAPRTFIRAARAALTGAGLFEARSSILVGPGDLERLGLSLEAVSIANPITKDESLLRPSLLPGLLNAMARNFSRRNLDVRLFEVGSVFGRAYPPKESSKLALAMGGETDQTWYSRARVLDFYDLKGAMEALLAALGVRDYEFRASGEPPFHPARCAELSLEGERLGLMGELGKQAAKALDIPYPVLLAEMDLEILLRSSHELEPGRVEASRFPAVLLDLAMSVPEAEPAEAVVRTALRAGGESLESISLVDVYRGEQAGEGRKSLALSLVFRDASRTLTEDEAVRARDDIVSAIAKRHQGRLRG